jgi:chaperonin GroES
LNECQRVDTVVSGTRTSSLLAHGGTATTPGRRNRRTVNGPCHRGPHAERAPSWPSRSSRSRTASSIQPLEAETTTASGLYIPDTAKEKPQEGKVVAVGPGRIDDSGKRIPLDVAEGDVVIFSKYGGTEVKYDGAEYLLLNARDILAVVTK